MGEFVRFQRWETVNLAPVREVIRASRNARAEPLRGAVTSAPPHRQGSMLLPSSAEPG